MTEERQRKREEQGDGEREKETQVTFVFECVQLHILVYTFKVNVKHVNGIVCECMDVSVG